GSATGSHHHGECLRREKGRRAGNNAWGCLMQRQGGQGRVGIGNSTPLRIWQSECIPILGKLAATLAILERSMLGGPAALISASDQFSAVVVESVPWL